MTFRHQYLVPRLSRLTDLLRRLGRAVDGVETIEFALAAIPLLMFLLGVVEFARLYWVQSELQYAAEAGARCLTTNCCGGSPTSCANSNGNSGVRAYTAGQVLGMTVSSSDLQNFQVTSPAPACGNQISFSYHFHFLVGQIVPHSDITLSTTACHQA